MNNDLKTMWEDVVMAQYKDLSRSLHRITKQGPRITSVSTDDIREEIWTQNLKNT
jgi:hypothetical protein